MSDQTEPEADHQFATDFRDGAAMAREWIEGKVDLPDLLHMVRDMPRGSDMGGLEAGFLASIDAAVRGGRPGAAAAPDQAKATLLLTPPEAPTEAAQLVDLDEMLRQRRERERKARLAELGRQNAALFIGQQRMVGGGGYMRKVEDWRGW